MKWVATAKEMRSIDSRTINKIGIPASTLMERAGLEVVNACIEKYGSVAGKTVCVFCGKGNNGGDGFVIAREMKRRGAVIAVYVFGRAGDLQGESLQNYAILRKMKIPVVQVTTAARLRRIPDTADILVDALLGTGIRGEVTGILREAIRKINAMSGAVVSVDLPSGLITDTGAYVGECVRADLTVTMGLLKRGLLLHPGKMLAGSVVTADIGFPERGISPERVQTFLIEQEDIRSFLPQRLPYFYKGDCGRVLIIGGSPGMTGAPSLTAAAALRAGAGMTLLGIPESLNPIFEQKLTETMTLPLPETADGFLSLEAETPVMEALMWADVLAIGPGIGRKKETMELVLNVLKNTVQPVVIDADGLYALAKDTNVRRARAFNTIITPHLGEFARLIKRDDTDTIESERIELVRKYAQRRQSVVLLKGAPTVIAGRRGEVFINSTGNAGMATAGSGDVLTGVVAGLAAQGMDLTSAGISGAYLHGRAGDLAADELGEPGVIANDLVDFLPYAFEYVRGRHTKNSV